MTMAADRRALTRLFRLSDGPLVYCSAPSLTRALHRPFMRCRSLSRDRYHRLEGSFRSTGCRSVERVLKESGGGGTAHDVAQETGE